MLLTILFLATALGGIFTAYKYWRLRQQELAAYIALRNSTGDDVRPAAQKYWGLDKLAKRWALSGIGLWAITAIANMFAKEHDALSITLIVASTVSFITVSIIATVFNDRESDTRLKARWEIR